MTREESSIHKDTIILCRPCRRVLLLCLICIEIRRKTSSLFKPDTDAALNLCSIVAYQVGIQSDFRIEVSFHIRPQLAVSIHRVLLLGVLRGPIVLV